MEGEVGDVPTVAGDDAFEFWIELEGGDARTVVEEFRREHFKGGDARAIRREVALEVHDARGVGFENCDAGAVVAQLCL